MYCNFEYGLTEKVTSVSEPQGGREGSQAGVLVKSIVSRRNSKSTMAMSAVEVHAHVQRGWRGGGQHGGRAEVRAGIRGGMCISSVFSLGVMGKPNLQRQRPARRIAIERRGDRTGGK